jgi:hypothetical protein
VRVRVGNGATTTPCPLDPMGPSRSMGRVGRYPERQPRKRKCGMEFWVERGSGETVGDFIFRGVHRRAQSEANRLFDAGCLEVRGWH